MGGLKDHLKKETGKNIQTLDLADWTIQQAAHARRSSMVGEYLILLAGQQESIFFPLVASCFFFPFIIEDVGLGVFRSFVRRILKCRWIHVIENYIYKVNVTDRFSPEVHGGLWYL